MEPSLPPKAYSFPQSYSLDTRLPLRLFPSPFMSLKRLTLLAVSPGFSAVVVALLAVVAVAASVTRAPQGT